MESPFIVTSQASDEPTVNEKFGGCRQHEAVCTCLYVHSSASVCDDSSIVNSATTRQMPSVRGMECAPTDRLSEAGDSPLDVCIPLKQCILLDVALSLSLDGTMTVLHADVSRCEATWLPAMQYCTEHTAP
jgi:hypothetical protein